MDRAIILATLKFTLMECGDPFATMAGDSMRHTWPVDKWDSHVHVTIMIIICPM